ncbi:hypothetical protein GALMADRAFT_468631 [Galerina marginata CBS 339.88]|uniref:Uncharacterized protein n=1 Tax=Galerina marginata (strain CBS 339.88) TaxID=685588 RepID=A0A067SZE4_GALM3|nr:hypothetical protein GALMADRAFT_468631 [Galerina marginata CBS 339.88]
MWALFVFTVVNIAGLEDSNSANRQRSTGQVHKARPGWAIYSENPPKVIEGFVSVLILNVAGAVFGHVRSYPGLRVVAPMA